MKPIVPRSAALASALMLLCACAVQPRPIQDADHVARAEVDRSRLRADQAPLTGRLALEDAISRALAYNLDARLTMMEQALQGAQLTAANFAMLPRLAANAGYAARSNELAASAESVFTRRQTLEPSTSTDRQRGFADLTFAWNIIDVGLSYFQARQQADRALIAVERRRRVINNLVKDMRAAYWRVATAERLMPDVERLLVEAERAIAASRRIEAERLEDPVGALEYRRTLLDLSAQLRRLRADLASARVQLASLIGLPPGEPYTLASPAAATAPPRLPDTPQERLEIYALVFRPELREEAYQERIDRDGIRREFIRLLPGVSILAGINHDTNSFL